MITRHLSIALGLIFLLVTGAVAQTAPPVLDPIGAKTTNEGVNLTFSPSASDPDGDTPVMSASTLPGTATYVDNGNGTGTFDWTPTFGDSGTYDVTFYAADSAFPAVIDSEIVTITVTNVNQEPVLALIGSQSTDENVNLTFSPSASDPDGDTPVMSASVLPGTATYVDNGNGTGTFDWTPTFGDSGTYDVTFYAADSAFPAVIDSEQVTITVTNVNQDPVLALIGSQSTDENVNLTFSPSASDPDGDTPVMSASTLPGAATYVDNGNGTGTFNWTPTFGDSGTYNVTFYAADSAFPAVIDSEQVTITVTNVNQEPVLALIGSQSTDENVNLTFSPSASDPDGDTPVMSASTLPGTATYVDNGNGTGTFDWTPTFGDSGTYDVTFYAADSAFPAVIDSEIVTITVTNVNQEPVLALIGSQSTDENVNLTFSPSASDPDGDTPVMSASTLPGTATYIDNGNGTGTFNWTPTFGDSGTYDVTFYAADSAFPAVIDSEIVTITVTNVNQEPVLALIGSQSTDENVNLTFSPSASDPDGDTPVMSASTLPGTATYVDNGNGTGTFDWTPTFGDSGTYDVTFYAADSAFPAVIDSEIVTITVTNVNQHPVLASIGAQGTNEGVNLTFSPSASDPDGDTPVMSSSTLPGTATYVDNGNGTGTFDWTPTFGDSGTYDVTFYAADSAFPAVIDSEQVTITVTNVNQDPVLALIGSQSTDENVNLTFSPSASDPDGDTPVMSASILPGTATYVDNGNGTGTFNWTPTFSDSGTYDVTFYAADSAFPAVIDSEQVTITVTNVNQEPVLALIGSQSTAENVNLTFSPSASDPDGDTPVMSASTLPGTATYVDNGNGTGTFNWTPTFGDSGTYNVTFYAADSAFPAVIDSEQVTITVTNVNQEPVLALIGSQSTAENVNLTFSPSASDPDGDTPVMSASILPGTATYVDNGNGTGTFDWTPTFGDSGTYNVTFYAADSAFPAVIDSEQVTITVTNVNQEPVLALIGLQSTDENVNLTFSPSASDPDGDTPVMSASALPGTATYVDNGNGTGTFDWTPTFGDSGTYNVTFYAADSAFPAVIDSEQVTITVTNVNQEPVLASIGAQGTNEGVNLTFSPSASDPDGDTPVMSASTLPGTATYVDNGNGTGTFDWTPTFGDSGTYDVTFYAADSAFPAVIDSEQVTITVTNVNQEPVLALIGSQSTDENVNLTFSPSASDPDGDTPVMSASILPGTATYVDNGNGTGTFDWTPTFGDSGTYDVTFYAADSAFPAVIDSEQVTITVTNVNQHPVLSAIGPQSVTEGAVLTIGTSASDPDGDIPAMTSSSLPGTATYIDNGDGTGSFSWTPSYIESGDYNVTFYATDGAFPSDIDSETVVITVVEAGNQDPVLAPIGPKSVTEGSTLAFSVTASDPESIPTLTASNLPAGAAFVDNGDGTGDFTWTPGYTESGIYNVTFFAADDSASLDGEVVTITVNEAGNQLPVLAAIGAQSTAENVLLTFGVSATDAESIPTLSNSTLPTGAGFTDNGDGTGSFSWTPTFTQSGTYPITFYATDDSAAVDSEVVIITVTEPGNQLPVLAAIGAQSTTENVPMIFGVSATDAEGAAPTLTSSTLPTGATFVDNGNGTGDFNWTPDYLQSGIYDVTFYATDDSAAVDSEVVTITVLEAGNQLPLLATIGAQSTVENVLLAIGVSATDVESTPTLTTSALPSGATFVDNGDGTGDFDWTPTYLQSGGYPVTFYATDDSAAVDSEVVTITVNEAGNQLPILISIGAQSTTESVLLVFGVTATDIESVPVLTTSTLPTGATFVDNGNGSGDFDWTPTYMQSGSYPVTFYATDDSAAVDSEVVVITVNEAGNQLPQLAAIGSQSTTESVLLTIGVSATDAESTPLMTTSTLPTGATFVDNGDGSGTFDWTPGFTDAGIHNVTFYATDDSAAVDSEQVVITVSEAGNQPPVLASIGPKSTDENVALTFGVSATDPDVTIPALSTSTLPVGATFVDNGDGSGTFDWTPSFVDAGIHNVIFYADDGSLIDSEQVVITVNEVGNQPPVLAAIGSQTTTEGINLNFGVSSADAESTPTLTTSSLPTGASFVDNGDGSGTFDWTPVYVQSGDYDITFYATDDSAAVDSEQVTITVNEAGNQPPELQPIGAQIVLEGVLLSLPIIATDADSTFPSLHTSILPTGATFVDNGDGTGSFDWTPDFFGSGVYVVLFYASDGLVDDSEFVTITVTEAGNQTPVLAAIGPQSGTEDVLLNIAVTAADSESIPSLTTSTLPTGASFIDHGDGSGDFNWTSGFTDAGIYSVTFYATDDSAAVDSELVTITINEAGNQSPVLDPIGPQATTENVNLNFGITASDPDATIPALSTSILPTGATFVDNGDGSGDFNWTPGFTDAGSHNVTFYADDGALIDSEQVVITINEAGNQSPVLDPIGPQATTENVNLNFGITASDPDATIPALSTSILPTGATFVDNGDGSGDFNWTPGFTDAGSHNVTFYADDGALIDSEQVVITINEAGNQSPVLDPIGPQATTENVNLNFGVTATDPDATIPVLSTSTLPSGASFIDNGDGSGDFDWIPGFTDAGIHNVTFYADDGALIDSEQVVITINEAGNQSPVLDPIGPQATTENVNLNFGITASDPDATIPALSISGLPTGATFVDNGDGSGTFDWIPGFTDAGIHNVTFYADDGALIDSEQVVITVNEAGNQSPVLDPIGPQATTENVNLNFGITASDPDATIPALSTSTLPTGATFVDNGNGSGTFDWIPGFTDAGIHNVTFYADDGALIDSEQVVITINEAGNQSPVLDPIGPQATTENVNLNFGITASDPDATIPALSTSILPTGASFIDHGDGSGDFNWTPGFTDAGIYSVTFYADDGALIDSEQVVITVNEAGNQSPVLDPIGPQATTENVNLNFGVTASDPDATIPALSTSILPTGATFVDNGDGSGTFDWIPGFTDAGIHNVTFYADDGALIDSEQVVITINEAGNQPPVLDPIGPQTGTEDVNLNFGITATDPDATIPALSTSALPTGATFVDNGDGSGTFDWIPGFTDAGIHNVTFYADDGALIDSEQVVITVNEAGNQSPVLDPIGPQTGTEDVNLNFGITASDPDATIPALSTSILPTGATFVDNGDGSGTFDWIPGFTDAGIHNVTFYADDGALIDSEQVVITINEAGNQSPVLDPIGPQAGTEDVNMNFGVTASDVDATIPALSTSILPTGATFVDNGDGSGTFDWIPGFTDAGIHNVTFYADDGALIDSEQVVITINEAGNQSPVLDPIGPQATTENVSLNFGVTASDPDATIPALSTSTLPTGATFIDNGDGSGTFDWIPGFTDAGIHNVTFYADDGALIDSEQVVITINEAGNQSPVLDPIGPQATTENVNLNFGITASDPDATIPALSTSILPTGATFVDNGDGSGDFNWTPGFTDAGSHNVTFYADDGALIDSEQVVITINEAGNQSPVLDPIGPQATTENVSLNFGITASDPDATIPALSTSILPTGATFVDNGDGSGTFDWIPGFTDAGIHNVTFYADDGALIDSEQVVITINEAGNQSPVLDPIGPQATTENVNLNFGITASDPDATIPALSTSILPTGATFVDNGDGSGVFDWIPGFTDAGTHNVTFYADDGLATDSEIVTITVTDFNRGPTTDAGPDQFSVAVGSLVTLDGTFSSDPDGDPLNYNWLQIGGTIVTLSDNADSMPTFTPPVTDTYLFELTVDDGVLFAAPDTVSIDVVNVAPPVAVGDLTIQIIGDAIQLGWSAISLDTDGFATTVDRYVISRGTSAYFTPGPTDSVGATDNLTTIFTDSDLGGANVVGDTLNQYFYVVEVVDIFGNRSAVSNRVGEYDYQLVTTATTNYNLVGVPFANTGITDADGLIGAIGNSNVFTVNNFNAASQSFEARFAAGFGTNFVVSVGGIYQVNAATDTIFSLAGSIPDSGTVSYSLQTTPTTDFNFLMIPFELEDSFAVAQDLLDSIPGVLNTLNNFVAGSQSYESRFAAGFGTNFPVNAGKPYQGNAAMDGVFPGP